MTLTALDLFAGAGGATQGLRDAGFDVLGAVENDPAAAESYRLNHPDVRLWTDDIRRVTATSMRRDLNVGEGELTVLKACPPCQGFSTLAKGRVTANEKQNDLVLHTVRFVRTLRPQTVLLENVPGLGLDARASRLIEGLRALGYVARLYPVNAVEFGVPQRRKRLIILARRGLRSVLPEELSPVGLEGGEAPTPSVGTAFEQLAKAMDPSDPLNRRRTLSDTVQRRVEAVPVGGTRFDLPEDLRLECHNRLRARNATGSYGRLRLDEPAPTITTRCTTPACGSFIHPTEHRGITLREAATLQTFPVTYRFSGHYGEIERQIGNAVPVKMAAELGRIVSNLVG